MQEYQRAQAQAAVSDEQQLPPVLRCWHGAASCTASLSSLKLSCCVNLLRRWITQAASTTGRPAAAGASAASAVLYAPAAYAPSAGPSLTQPKPRHDYAMDAEGNLIPARHWRSLAKSQLDVAAAASGWSSDIPRKRAWQEAFAALFGAVRIDQQELMGGSSA